MNTSAEGFCGVAFGNGRYVAVTAVGRSAVFTSADGVGWTLTDTAAETEFQGWTYRGVAFADGQFVVVQHYGRVRTSADAEHWQTGEVLSSGGRPAQMRAAGDRLFAPGLGVSSADGHTWVPLRMDIRSVAYGGGRYVAVGDGGLSATSADGVTWAPPWQERVPALNTITYAGGRYVALGEFGLAFVSADGATWTGGAWEHGVMRDWQGTGFASVSYGNGRYVAVNGHGGKLLTSTDGLTWRQTWSTDTPAPGGVLLFADGRFVAGTPKGIVVAADGENWELVYPGEGLQFTGLVWDGSRYVAVLIDSNQQQFLLASATGADWQALPAPPVQLNSLTYGSGRFVALSFRQDGKQPGAYYLLTSTDGVHWATGPDVPFYQVRYENGLFLGTPIDLYTSADGEDWRYQPTPTRVGGAAFIGGRLVAVGAYGSIVMSEPVCGRFLDLPAADVACPAVQALVRHQVVGGYPDGSFRPDGQVTRAELAAMLTRTLGWAPQPGAGLPFRDTAGHWAATGGYLQAARTAGVMTGYPDNNFRPNGAITRAELIKTVLSAAGIQPSLQATSQYGDISSARWYAPWVAAAEKAGLIGPGGSGLTGPEAEARLWADSVLDPDRPATRAEAARLLQTLLP